MSDFDFPKVVEAMEKVVRKHFPSISESKVGTVSRELINELTLASALEKIERSDKKPQKDLDNLLSAANNLRLAAKKISQVGWHGQKHLEGVLQAIFEDPAREAFCWNGSRDLARSQLVRHIKSLEAALKEASEKVDLDGLPVETAFSGDPEAAQFKETKPEKTAARLFAGECAKVFGKLQGSELRRQNVIHSWQGDGSYSSFKKFLSDAFKAAGIKASAATFADEVIR